MQYRVLTYLSFHGKVDVIDLSDLSYGEWIVYDNKVPKYHINCFEKNDSDLKIKYLLDKKKNINNIIDIINNENNITLSLSNKPLGIMIKSELKNLELKPFPISWVENI
jgi:hypothetical protein